MLVAQLCLTLCDPVYCSPPGSFVHGDSPGKNTGVGCHSLLQGIFPTRVSRTAGRFSQHLHMGVNVGLGQQGSPWWNLTTVLYWAQFWHCPPGEVSDLTGEGLSPTKLLLHSTLLTPFRWQLQVPAYHLSFWPTPPQFWSFAENSSQSSGKYLLTRWLAHAERTQLNNDQMEALQRVRSVGKGVEFPCLSRLAPSTSTWVSTWKLSKLIRGIFMEASLPRHDWLNYWPLGINSTFSSSPLSRGWRVRLQVLT